MNRSKILQMLVLLAAIALIAGGLLRVLSQNSMSLTDYERLNASRETSSEEENGSDPDDKTPAADSTDVDGENPSHDNTADPNAGSEGSAPGMADLPDPMGEETSSAVGDALSSLTGASLNGDSQADSRVTLAEGFYYEPLSDELRRYITGISYPAEDPDSSSPPEITADELRYVHILHYDFEGRSAEGELICNEYIAADLTEIFYELFCNEYRLEKVLLIDEYDGDDDASMADNNTSCFNYRSIEEEPGLSRHAYGLAVDVNPLYNPHITWQTDGTAHISPEEAAPYADRSLNFPYKIDENDLCYKLFIQHGFTWGGNWNHSKDYQHFQKAKP